MTKNIHVEGTECMVFSCPACGAENAQPIDQIQPSQKMDDGRKYYASDCLYCGALLTILKPNFGYVTD